jgi:hypothetical protein
MQRERKELRTLRFAESQIAEAEALAAQFRSPRSNAGAIYLAVALPVGLGFMWLLNYFGDAMIALVATCVMAAPLLAAIYPRHSGSWLNPHLG